MNNISAARARKQTMFDFPPLRQECEADRVKRANARSLFVISEVPPTLEAATQTQSCENRAASYFRPCSKVKGSEPSIKTSYDSNPRRIPIHCILYKFGECIH